MDNVFLLDVAAQKGFFTAKAARPDMYRAGNMRR